MVALKNFNSLSAHLSYTFLGIFRTLPDFVSYRHEYDTRFSAVTNLAFITHGRPSRTTRGNAISIGAR